MKQLIKLALVVLLVNMTACATRTTVINTACSSFHLITPSRADILTLGTENQISGHNGAYRASCSRKPGLFSFDKILDAFEEAQNNG